MSIRAPARGEAGGAGGPPRPWAQTALMADGAIIINNVVVKVTRTVINFSSLLQNYKEQDDGSVVASVDILEQMREWPQKGYGPKTCQMSNVCCAMSDELVRRPTDKMT